MKIIGITGGIGSGKTTITKYIESLGIPVYIADDEAKKLLDTPDVIKELTDTFGLEIVQDGFVDKKKLASFVFGNEDNLKKLNEIVHPKVREHFINWTKQFDKSFVVKEAAILFESGAYKDCDITILVTAPEDVRVERVISRDNTNKEDVLKRIKSQWSDEDKAKLAEFTIEKAMSDINRYNILRITETIEHYKKNGLDTKELEASKEYWENLNLYNSIVGYLEMPEEAGRIMLEKVLPDMAEKESILLEELTGEKQNPQKQKLGFLKQKTCVILEFQPLENLF